MKCKFCGKENGIVLGMPLTGFCECSQRGNPAWPWKFEDEKQRRNRMKFRKKPVVIEAFQMTRARRESNAEWPEWLNRAWQLDWKTPGSLYPTEKGTGDGTLSITTLEGQHLVSWGDWIIQGVKGELYPCKPDIFEATYEMVEDDDQ